MEVLVPLELGFAAFVREHTPALLRTAYLLTGNGNAAEELVQDTLVRLYPKWDRVEAAEVPLAYVRRSLTNTYLNIKRRPASRELALDMLPERAESLDAAAQVAYRDELWALLRTLPERQRAALVLRYFHDLPDTEIGDALHCRVGTVRSLISRGLTALRAQRAGSTPPGRSW